MTIDCDKLFKTIFYIQIHNLELFMLLKMKCKISKKIFEDGETSGAYATTMNTIGIGDPVPAGTNTLGSGDKFDNTKIKIAKKKGPKKIIKLKNVNTISVQK